ncbi:MAG: GYDIA family GHMP kinase [Lentimicrobium sp.]|jgi:mevalonate kinase|nr:GYDIA family GHMP kinase [Lentimicrobium sp.]
MNSERIFHANGKILLTGEYLVMQGALSLALPLKLGQQLAVYHISEPVLNWEAYDTSGQWFSARIKLPSFDIIESSDPGIAQQLLSWLRAARGLNSRFLQEDEGSHVRTSLDFDRQWGFGSSSTLIYCLAHWAGIDVFKLHQKVSAGSGYDVACAGADRPLLYQLLNNRPAVTFSSFSPSFASQLYLVYLGRKQHSGVEVEGFKYSSKDFSREVEAISAITLAMENGQDLSGFMKLMNEHESILAKILERDTIKSLKFSNFDGEIKSLGAWGGDFIMAASPMEPGDVNKYFADKGYHIILPFASTVAGLSASATINREGSRK